MSVEFTFVANASVSALPTLGDSSFFFDPAETELALLRIADAGFQSIVVDDSAGALANFDLSVMVASTATPLRIVLTHWAGIMSPMVAARQLSRLHRKARGQLSLRMLVDGKAEAYQGANRPSHIAAWKRTDEYLRLLKRLWINDEPIDHEGEFYSVRKGIVPLKSKDICSMPVTLSGLSGTALRVAGRHADRLELPMCSVDEAKMLIARARAVATESGRADKVGFTMPIRLGDVSGFDTPTSGPDLAARMAVSLLRYVEAGVTEFMVIGLEASRDIPWHVSETVRLLRNSVGRVASEAPELPAVQRRRAHRSIFERAF